MNQSTNGWGEFAAMQSIDEPFKTFYGQSSMKFYAITRDSEPWSYVDRVGGQFVVINSFDNLRRPDDAKNDLSHYSYSPPSLHKYNAERRLHFIEKLPEAIFKLETFRMEQLVKERAEFSSKRQKFS